MKFSLPLEFKRAMCKLEENSSNIDPTQAFGLHGHVGDVLPTMRNRRDSLFAALRVFVKNRAYHHRCALTLPNPDCSSTLRLAIQSTNL